MNLKFFFITLSFTLSIFFNNYALENTPLLPLTNTKTDPLLNQIKILIDIAKQNENHKEENLRILALPIAQIFQTQLQFLDLIHLTNELDYSLQNQEETPPNELIKILKTELPTQSLVELIHLLMFYIGQQSQEDTEQETSKHKKFKCSYPGCNAEFTSKPHLCRHRDSTHLGKRFTCPTCGQTFVNKHDIEEHILSQHEGQSFKCPYPDCEKTYDHKTDLTRHIKTEHLQPKFTCDLCGHKFPDEEKLKAHTEEKHNKDNKFECDQCHQRYATEQSLSNHKRHVHLVQRLKCPTCGKEFADVSKLNRHINGVHDKIKVSCPHCHSEFSTQNNLQRHIKQFHS